LARVTEYVPTLCGGSDVYELAERRVERVNSIRCKIAAILRRHGAR
jgi:hypothetical protein